MERILSSLVCLCLVAASGAQQLFAGESCSTSDGQRGSCRRIDSCQPAFDSLLRGWMPTICSYDKRMPVVCCVSGTTTSTTTTTTTTTATPHNFVAEGGEGSGQKARAMCERYMATVRREVLEVAPSIALGDNHVPPARIRPRCGEPETLPLIIGVGGEEAKPKEFPHMAAVGYGDEKNIAWLCGGTLISERFVLTAAHCLISSSRGLSRWVRLGDLNIAKNDDDAKPQQFSVAERIRHPGYSAFSAYNDIALLRLNTSATFNAYVRPACLNADRHVAQRYFFATGWGIVHWADDAGSDHLIKVLKLPEVSAAVCNRTYGSLIGTRRLKFGIQEDKMLCAGVEEGGRDTCRGDSGGPLQFLFDPLTCTYSVVGLTSFGSTVCGARNSPAVYTRVSHYLPWIEGIVWP